MQRIVTCDKGECQGGPKLFPIYLAVGTMALGCQRFEMSVSCIAPPFAEPGEVVSFKMILTNTSGSERTGNYIVGVRSQPSNKSVVMYYGAYGTSLTLAAGANREESRQFTMPDDDYVTIELWWGTIGAYSVTVFETLSWRVSRALGLPALTEVAMNSIVNSVITGLGSLSFAAPSIADLAPPSIEVPPLGIGLPSRSMDEMPHVQLDVARIRDILVGLDLKKLPPCPSILPDVFIDFAFARVDGSPTESVWAAVAFPKPFLEPPTVTATLDFREGWFEPISMTPPEISVAGMTLEDFRNALSDVHFEPPAAMGNFPSPEEIKADIDAKLKDVRMDVTNLKSQVEQQAKNALKGKLGDWKVGPFSLNGIRDIIVAALIAVVIITAVLTAPAAFLAMVILAGLLVAGVVKLLYDVAQKQQAAFNAISSAQAAISDAVQKYTNDIAAQIQKYAYDLNNLNLAAMNSFAEVHTRQAEAALNNAVNILYGMSDLPRMKLPVCAVRNVSRTGCEVLIPKGGTANLFVVGKVSNPLEGFLPRVASQLSQFTKKD